jgi:hypothetical protein
MWFLPYGDPDNHHFSASQFSNVFISVSILYRTRRHKIRCFPQSWRIYIVVFVLLGWCGSQVDSWHRRFGTTNQPHLQETISPLGLRGVSSEKGEDRNSTTVITHDHSSVPWLFFVFVIVTVTWPAPAISFASALWEFRKEIISAVVSVFCSVTYPLYITFPPAYE